MTEMQFRLAAAMTGLNKDSARNAIWKYTPKRWFQGAATTQNYNGTDGTFQGQALILVSNLSSDGFGSKLCIFCSSVKCELKMGYIRKH